MATPVRRIDLIPREQTVESLLPAVFDDRPASTTAGR
jgi:hypothetical protein